MAKVGQGGDNTAGDLSVSSVSERRRRGSPLDGESVHAILHWGEGVPEASADEPDRHDEVPEADWCRRRREDLQAQPDGECKGNHGERDEAGDC